MTHGNGIVAHLADDGCRATAVLRYLVRAIGLDHWLRDRCHISEMTACIEAEDEVVVDNSELGVVEEAPADEVGKREVTVAPRAIQCIALDKLTVTRGDVMKSNHNVDFY